MKKRLLNKYLPGAISAIMLVSTIGLSLPQKALAEDVNVVENENIIQDNQIEKLFTQNSDFYKFLEGLEKLPKGIANKEPQDIAKWLTNQTGVEVIADGENLLVPSLAKLGSDLNSDFTLNNGGVTTFGLVDCAIAVGLMIGTVGFPASKILKLKEAIDHLGGITKTVSRIFTKYNQLKSENWRTVPAWKEAVSTVGSNLTGDVKMAFLDFFNITNVMNQCTG